MNALKHSHASRGDIILVIPGGIGDTILFTPVIDALSSWRPRPRMEAIVAQKNVADLLGALGLVDKCHLVNSNGTTPVKIAGFLKLLYIVVARRFDTAVIASGCHPAWAYLLKYAGRVRRIVQGSHFRGSAVTDFESNVAAAMSLRRVDKMPKALFPVTADQQHEAAAVAVRHGVDLDEGHLCAMYISRPVKPGRLPPAGFLEIVRRLKSRFPDMAFVLLGDTVEREEWRAADTAGDVVNLAGALSLGACGHVFKKAKIAICNDGGLMHIAAAVGSPLIAILGETGMNYLPSGDRLRMVVHRGIADFPLLSERHPQVSWRAKPDASDIVAIVESEWGVKR